MDLYYPELNFVARERLELFAIAYRAIIGERGWHLFSIAIQAAVLFAGFYMLCGLPAHSRRARLWGAAAGTIGVLVSAGINPFFLRMHWLPLLLWSLLHFELRGGVRRGLLCGVIALCWIWSAGGLAAFGGLFLAVSASFFLRHRLLPAPGLSRGGVALCLLIVLAGFLTVPSYPYPAYPGNAQLAPISPLLRHPLPLLGGSFRPNPLLYYAYRHELEAAAVRFMLLLVSCAGLFLWGQAPREHGMTPEARELSYGGGQLPILIIGLVTLLAGCSELVLPPAHAPLALFPTAARLIPGLSTSALAWLLLPFGWTLVVLEASRSSGSIQLSRFGLLLVPIAIAAWVLFPSRVSWLEAGEGVAQSFVHSPEGSLERAADRPPIERSPSGFLVRTVGPWAANRAEGARRSFEKLVRLEQGKDFEASASASITPEEASRALDGRAETRWRTARPQRPGDSFRITLDRPVPVIRIVLSVQRSPTDFPRGLQVVSHGERRRVLFEQRDWLGPVYWSEDQYPYFGPQSHVIIDLEHEETVEDLEFVQLGSDDRFDWSIGEIKLYRLP